MSGTHNPGLRVQNPGSALTIAPGHQDRLCSHARVRALLAAEVRLRITTATGRRLIVGITSSRPEALIEARLRRAAIDGSVRWSGATTPSTLRKTTDRNRAATSPSRSQSRFFDRMIPHRLIDVETSPPARNDVSTF